jgi:hypothetical protein
MTTVSLQVSGAWAGTSGGWRPAVSGTLNQSTLSDESASEFESRAAAVAFYEQFVLPELPDDEGATPDGCKFRLVHADGSTEQGTF